ncbi:hypothetical protein D3C71_2115390 [compost metagenome]
MRSIAQAQRPFRASGSAARAMPFTAQPASLPRLEVPGAQLPDGVAQHLGGRGRARHHGQFDGFAVHPVVALHL